MSSSWVRSSNSESGSSFDVEELLRIGTRYKELELREKSFSEARLGDRMYIEKLERELMNSCQEIDYLQDQLKARNSEVDYLSEYIRSLELKLSEMEKVNEEIDYLRGELKNSKCECLLLLQELENREVELQSSISCTERLEESISSLTLEYQCEIESLKLDMVALEQANSEARKIQEQSAQEKARMNRKIEELQIQFQKAKKNIQVLEEENTEFREKYVDSQIYIEAFCQKIRKYLEGNDRTRSIAESCFGELMNELSVTKEKRNSRQGFDAVLSKLVVAISPDPDLSKKMEGMSEQISEYEHLVKQLKEELREEKFKAKEEAEDLAQEMAELRYKMTCLLEEECKRRACIEKASLQRISELEAQVKRESSKSASSIIPLHNV